MAPNGYPNGYRYLADSGRLNAYSGATIQTKGFDGVIPYVGIGGGGSLPDKRLSRTRYNDYINTGIAVPAAFVEGGTNDADGGYSQGLINAQAALADLEAMRIDIPIIIAVNDKTGWNANDIEYVRGFRDVVGNHRCGVYGFSTFLAAVHIHGYASYYHQCGNSPVSTGSDNFVHVWQRNDGVIDGLDVNQVLKSWTHLEDELINFFVDDGSRGTDGSFSRVVMEIGSLVYNTTWQQYQAKLSEGIASLTGLATDDFNALMACSDGQKSVPALIEMLIAKVGVPIDVAGVTKAVGGALKNAGTALDA